MAVLALGACSANLACASVTEARELYDRGLQHLNEGDYVAAKLAFEHAYQESPHHVVLFNLAKVCEQLGQTAQALIHVERFLVDGGDQVAPERRAQAEAMRQRLKAKLSEDPGSGSPPSFSGEAPATPRPPAVAPADVPPLGSSGVRAEAGSRAAAAGREEGGAALEQRRSPAWVYAFGGAGAVLVGTSLVLWQWNNGRYDAWRAENRALTQTPRSPSDTEPELAAERARRVADNRRLQQSIQHYDVVSVASGVTGIGLAAAAVYLHFSSAPEPAKPAGFALTPTGVRLGLGFIEYRGTY